MQEKNKPEAPGCHPWHRKNGGWVYPVPGMVFVVPVVFFFPEWCFGFPGGCLWFLKGVSGSHGVLGSSLGVLGSHQSTIASLQWTHLTSWSHAMVVVVGAPPRQPKKNKLEGGSPKWTHWPNWSHGTRDSVLLLLLLLLVVAVVVVVVRPRGNLKNYTTVDPKQQVHWWSALRNIGQYMKYERNRKHFAISAGDSHVCFFPASVCGHGSSYSRVPCICVSHGFRPSAFRAGSARVVLRGFRACSCLQIASRNYYIKTNITTTSTNYHMFFFI